ncbi:MAG: alpha-L-arabinofuranosidase C-terminal domain-containing protein [Bacteroidales bacterium]
MNNLIKILFLLIILLTGCKTSDDSIVINVHDEVIAPVDNRVFGQFLEKPSWHGEWGPEAALVPGTHELQDGVFELMEEMHIPVLRFPGGTDVNFQDWTTMIDNVPGRKEGRPVFVGHFGDTVTNYFGYDEACRLAEKLGAEMMLVPNFGDAYFGTKSIEEAAMHEAGLLAYCNAEVGATLPEGMPDWPSVRAKNGHPEPYNVKYIQIANEPWVMDRQLKRSGEIDPHLKEQYFDCVAAFIKAFKKVDPDIQIIADGNSEDITLPLKDMFGDQIDYLAYHIYKPWGINKILRGEEELPRDSLTEEDIWKAWVAVPEFNDEGMSVIDNGVYNMMKDVGYPVAVTEWNWNGWWGMNSVDQDQLGSHFTKGMGAAGFIHALMRDGDKIAIANQSMLVGKSWGITGIRVSPTMEFEPHLYPTGQVTGFYSRYHGNELMKVSVENNPVYTQPYKMSGISPVDTIAYLDVLATRNSDKVYLHVINRHFSDDLEVTVNFSVLSKKGIEATHHIFTGNLKNEPCGDKPLEVGCFNEQQVKVKTGKSKINFPARSVSIVEFF